MRFDFLRASAVVLLAALSSACIVIEDGEVGVAKRFGDIQDEPVLPGVAFQIPVALIIETWNVKLQEIKETANVPSADGLIVGLDTSLLFRVKPEAAPSIRENVGRNYIDTLITPYLRNSIRDVVSGYPVTRVYVEEGRREIAAKMKAFLIENLEPRGITVVDVLLRDLQLPENFKRNIEEKTAAEQRVQQKEYELQQAEKEAQIEITRAKGAAEAQQIVRSTLSPSYLQYLWIKTLNENPNVIYVATEANLPIFRNVGEK